MIDIHNHILYGVDDGSSSLEESIEILKKAYENGYTDIILTPHYCKGKDYCSTKKENLKKLNILKKSIKKENININLYLGNEVYIDDDILENLNKEIISTLNDSKYLLIEFPLWSKVGNAHNVIFELVSNGITPIIAHPERYRYYHNDIKELETMIEEGALLQGNIASLYNKYGRNCKKMLKKLIKKDMITFLATDTHSINSDMYNKGKDLTKKLKRLTKSNEKVKELIELNQLKIIERH